MTGVRCVVFDFDGVLVDSNAIKRDAYRQVLEHRGASTELLNNCLASNPEGDRTEIIAALLGLLSGASSSLSAREEVERYVAAYSKVCLDGVSSCSEVLGASAALQDLSGEFALYINSATPEAALEDVVAARGWSRYFRNVMGKPHSKIENLGRVVSHERVPADTIVFVGDKQLDLTAAVAFGCRFVGVRSDESDFREPCTMLETLEGLPALVRGFGRD